MSSVRELTAVISTLSDRTNQLAVPLVHPLGVRLARQAARSQPQLAAVSRPSSAARPRSGVMRGACQRRQLTVPCFTFQMGWICLPLAPRVCHKVSLVRTGVGDHRGRLCTEENSLTAVGHFKLN